MGKSRAARNHFLQIVFAHFRTRRTEPNQNAIRKCKCKCIRHHSGTITHTDIEIHIVGSVAILHPCRFRSPGLGKFVFVFRIRISHSTCVQFDERSGSEPNW